jgi:hypothetical protein
VFSFEEAKLKLLARAKPGESESRLFTMSVKGKIKSTSAIFGSACSPKNPTFATTISIMVTARHKSMLSSLILCM